MKALFPLLAGALLMTTAPASAHDSHIDTIGKISVSATGNSYQAPDIATVSAGVVTQGVTAQDAMRANARQMTAVFDALKAAGIQQRHIQTSQLSLNPQYDYTNRQKPRITGYEARNTVTAHSEDLDQVGPMLDALVTAGANNINGTNFSIKDAEAAKSDARREAVIDARRKAGEMAEAAGVSLGRILQMSESSHQSGPQPMMRTMAMESAGASTPIAGGEQTLSVTVNITYAID
ncbi:MAG: SIMPL domain-containing protein [Hellea sp.]|nr:SIMPL domain-containing protein [Hellea sp.]